MRHALPALGIVGALLATGCSDEPTESTPGGSDPGGEVPSTGGAAGAGGKAAVDGAATGGTDDPGETPDLTHTFPTIDVAAGDETDTLCQSWTLENDTPLFVNRVEARNRGAFHHSNWIWIPDDQYDGPDGTWPCSERSFDQIIAGAAGGVFFAQSTQAPEDTQAFPAGVAFEMPRRARIVGDLHLLNATTEAVTTDIEFDVFTLPPEEVEVVLQPMAFTNLGLDIAPLMTTEAHMECAVPQPDFDVYYVLPHYHALGTSMRVEVAGGPTDGAAIFSMEPAYGEPWGQTYDPPFEVRGATGLGITCTYDNPRPETVGYGIADQEMCVVLLYTDGRKAGGLASRNDTTTTDGGVHKTDAPCLSIAQ